jgi:hypothetical protein
LRFSVLVDGVPPRFVGIFDMAHDFSFSRGELLGTSAIYYDSAWICGRAALKDGPYIGIDERSGAHNFAGGFGG